MQEVPSATCGNKPRVLGPRMRACVSSVFALCLIACGSDNQSGNDLGGAAGDGEPVQDASMPDGSSDASFVDTTLTCGNGAQDRGEACDDGNTASGDGCSGDCRSVERTYACYEVNQPCVSSCTNGALDPGEECDDGNANDSDGCTSDCRVEDGWGCARPGAACVRLGVCGNGARERGEACDSGKTSDPGCVDCKIQDGYWCSTPGQACLPKVCGNGTRTPGEDCDDGNLKDGDGCSKSCQVETGWRCSTTGCSPICGDGLIKGRENCEDGNIMSGDGCSAGCVTEPGYNCETLPCKPAVCGNNKVEGGEGCDDGNTIGGDGCGPTCQNEPTVTVGTNPVVNTSCGDGMVTSGEACDDGNKVNGDGCSDACVVEAGFTCTESTEDPSSVRMKVTYRDFKGRDDSSGVHWHMKKDGTSGSPGDGLDLGIVGDVCTTANTDSCGRLDSDGKPTLDPRSHQTIHKTGDPQSAAVDSAAFALWYRDSNPDHVQGPTGDDIAVAAHPDIITPAGPAGTDFLELGRKDANVYSYTNTAFFPLDTRGFGKTTGQSHNFHFTTELRYFFQYRGGETLEFFGDDDVWVFVNGRLAVDIGGIHGPQYGRVVLGDEDSTCSVHGAATEPTDGCVRTAAEVDDESDGRFGLTKGQVYEIVLFNAERHPTGSQFKLTLAGFLAPRSYCTPKCGDGIVVGWEACDSGAANVDGVYGVCNTTCSHMDYCGDNIKQSDNEACDNGFNVDYTAGSSDACAPGCALPPACGDGIVQAPNELCDNGADNDDTKYGGCTKTCDWGPYCGDGIVNGDELCDDGASNVSANEAGRCGYDCKPAYILL